MRWIAAAQLTFLLILSGPAPSALAEIFRWVDEDGRVQYGDRPPADATAEHVEVGEGRSVSGDLEDRREQRERLLDVMQEERAADERADAEHARQEEKRRQNCTTATDRLRGIEEARYIYERSGDPDNPRVLDDGERAEYTARARQDVTNWCR